MSSNYTNRIFRNSNSIHRPTISYGLLCYTISPDAPKKLTPNDIKFLIYQRHDSFEYTEFLRGMWSSQFLHNTQTGMSPPESRSYLEYPNFRMSTHLIALFNGMCEQERQRIENYTFDELWDDLWVNHDYAIYKDKYASSKDKYTSIHKYIPFLLNTTTSTGTTPPWGIPKGRKNSVMEPIITTAMREFEEETKIPITELKVYKELDTLDEEYIGSDSKTYATRYFLCKSPKEYPPIYVNATHGIRKTYISEEASDIKWVTVSEASEYLSRERIILLETAVKQIQRIES